MYKMTVISYDEVCEALNKKQPNLNCLDMATYGSYVRQPCDDDYWDRLREEDEFINSKDLAKDITHRYHHTDEYILVSYLRLHGCRSDVLIAVDY